MQGKNDSEIGRELGIHRTTVKRYRQRGEKGAIGKEARIRVTQEALSQHFSDLCQMCEKIKDGLKVGQPEGMFIENLRRSETHMLTLAGGRGNEITATFNVDKGGIKTSSLSLEEELLFVALRQHMSKSRLRRLYQDWKDAFGEYVSGLSYLYDMLARQAERRTGLKTKNSDNTIGLTSYFVYVIYKDVCDHVFFNYRGFEGTDYAINTLKEDQHELRFGGMIIAHAGDRGTLERCQKVHQQMLKNFRMPKKYPPEVLSAVKVWHEIQILEREIDVALEKLILKRTFPGRCELCPD